MKIFPPFSVALVALALTACNSDSTSTTSVTAGPAGVNSLVAQQPIAVGSATCPYGGVAVQSGLDLNGDGILEASEVTNSYNLCSPSTCANPRYSAAPEIACPVDSGSIYQSFVGNGSFMAATDTGNAVLFSSSPGSGNATGLEVGPTGSANSNFFSYGADNEGYLNAVTALGNTYYSSMWYYDPVNEIDVNEIDTVDQLGNVTTLYNAPVNYWMQSISAMDSADVYFSGVDNNSDFAISEVTGVNSSSVVYDFGQTTSLFSAIAADPVNNRIYFTQDHSVNYLQLPITGSSAPQTLFTYSGANEVATTLTVDGQGRVYANCYVRIVRAGASPLVSRGGSTACPEGSLFRANADGSGFTALTDSSKSIFQLSYQQNANILYLENIDANEGPYLNLDRLLIEN